MYPQGLPLKETQANLHSIVNLFNATKTKDPKPSCTIMPTPIIPSLPLQEPIMQTQDTPLSLEVAPAQEYYKKDKETSVMKNQDQDTSIPFHILQDVIPPSQEQCIPPCPMSFPPPK